MYNRSAWSVSLALFLFGAAFGTAIRASQERSQEKVTVTAVEIPVRVLLKGQPVRDLTKDDFEVYENGVKQTITKCEIVRRRIAAPPAEPARLEAPQPEPRVFLIVLNVFDYTEAVGNALDYLFKNIFRPGDHAQVVTESRVMNVERNSTLEQAAESLKAELKKYKSASALRYIKVFQDLRTEADHLIAVLEGVDPDPAGTDRAMFNFFDHYRQALNAYSNQYLKVDLGFYENLIKRIQGLKGEKWAIFLQQREMFPEIKIMSRLDIEIENLLETYIEPERQVTARLIRHERSQLKQAMAFSGAIAPEALRDVFMRAGITFHLILMSSLRSLEDRDFELKQVGQDFEDGLRQISRATGGLLEFNNQPLEALKQAAELEDYHYVLVYQAKNPDSNLKRDIKVKVRKPGVEVISLKTYLPAGAPPPPLITDLKTENRTISFKISRCQMTGGRDGKQGQAEIQITIFDAQGKSVFEERKTIGLTKKETTLRINLGKGPGGEYTVTVRIVDSLTNQSASLDGKMIL
jgi:VWFA-related protein